MSTSMFDSTFMPHGHCYHWRPDILWTHVGADVVIALAYLSIPLTLLLVFAKRRDFPYRSLLALFAAFIFSCAITHLLNIWTIWRPDYVLEGYVKVATAVISLATAIALIPVLPKVLRMRTPEELEAVNETLRAEVRQREAAEKELEAAVANLKLKNHELERFSYVVSHDLQAPLRTIVSFNDLLNEQIGKDLTDEQRTAMGFIRQGAETMQRMVTEILSLSKIESMEKKFESVSIEELLEHVQSNLHADIARSGATIKVVGENHIVCGDRTQLHQLLQNLISNALKFHPPERPPVVEVSVEGRDSDVQIVVRDNGIGIPQHKLQEIFGAFSRLHAEEDYEGSGIGLSICKKIVERHQGVIRADSTPGEGSAFTFSLPRECNEG